MVALSVLYPESNYIINGFTLRRLITDPGSNSLEVDPYQELTDYTFAGAYTYQLKFYDRYGTPEDRVHQHPKSLLSADPKGIRDSARSVGMHYATSTPRSRVKLDFQKLALRHAKPGGVT